MNGSSPLARGTPGKLRKEQLPSRLIPARAGNTRLQGQRESSRAAHPRSRGEHVKIKKPSVAPTGSSPLARGTLHCPARRSPLPRLIPARAGNTSPVQSMKTSRSAHPRSRGEHAKSTAACRFNSGSSPLARGTPRRGYRRIPWWRLIPARAGNTKYAAALDEAYEAHPRSRGEHALGFLLIVWFVGSSPLARGTHGRTVVECHYCRLIPARAGNTRR